MDEFNTTNFKTDILDSVNLELHYFLRNNSHSLNAFAMNRSQYEFLQLVKEIAIAADIQFEMEIFPIAEGGIRQYFRFSAKEVRNGISIAVIATLLSTFIASPIAKITEKWIDHMFADKKLAELQKENLRLQNTKLKSEDDVLSLDKALKLIELEKNQKALIHKSRFYKTLQETPKVEKVSIKVTDSHKKIIFPEREVTHQDFPEYIIDSNELSDIIDENAEIEIISPVLKRDKYKWRGYYKGMPISFHMKSKEFKKRILSGEINFKSGFTINCTLRIRRFLDENGIEKVKSYAVPIVNSYCINDYTVETNEGRKKRLSDKTSVIQLEFSFD